MVQARTAGPDFILCDDIVYYIIVQHININIISLSTCCTDDNNARLYAVIYI